MTTTIRARPAGAAHFPPIPFARLLRAEWQKTIATRAIRWLLAATAVITIGALAVPLLFPRDITQSRASYLAWAGLGLTRLLPVVLMLAMTAEWSQRTAMTTFTQEPRRGRVLAAKILTGQAICLAGAGFAFLAAQAAVLAAHAADRHITTGWDWPQLAGFIAFILLTGAIGIAFGAMLHNTAVAIVTYFALAGAFSLLMIPALQAAGRWVNTGQTYGWVLIRPMGRPQRPDRDLLPAVDRIAPDTRPDPHPAPRRALTNVTPAADPSPTASWGPSTHLSPRTERSAGSAQRTKRDCQPFRLRSVAVRGPRARRHCSLHVVHKVGGLAAGGRIAIAADMRTSGPAGYCPSLGSGAAGEHVIDLRRIITASVRG